jgi:predicted nuclease of predicted toxin-antitoxin system
MKFLIDNALSPLVALKLRESGYDAVHVREFHLQHEEDIIIFERAFSENRIIVSADTDFGTLLASRQYSKPSVILFRRGAQRHPKQQAALLMANLPNIKDALEKGCIVVIEQNRLRLRYLPILD